VLPAELSYKHLPVREQKLVRQGVNEHGFDCFRLHDFNALSAHISLPQAVLIKKFLQDTEEDANSMCLQREPQLAPTRARKSNVCELSA
jgi:hypothetical protein